VTQPAIAARHGAGSLADPVGARLAQLAAGWGASGVLEDTAGRVVSHALVGSAPTCVVDAVLWRTSAPLHGARGPARTTGVVPGGPVLATTLDGWTGLVSVLPVAGWGHLWLLHSQDLDLEDVAAATAGLADVLARTRCTATDEVLLAALHGSASDCDPDASVAVVRPASGAVNPVDLVTALRQGLTARAELTATGTEAYLVLRGGDAVRQVEQALEHARARLGVALAATLAPATRGLPEAREQAERALAARAEPGRCLTTTECRPYAALPALLDAVLVTDLGEDPLAPLDDALAETLRAWLDHHGDSPAAARSLGVHPNTFRYRLGRARDLVLADLDDPVARLEVHLLLLARRVPHP
jgi:hypothetical protein